MAEVKTDELLPYPSEKFIDQENLEAFYYKEEQVIHFVWKSRSAGDEYRKPFVKAFEFSEDHPAKFFLTDIRKQGIVGPDDRKWFEEEGLPLAISRGLTKAAVIFDGNIFKQYYINMILKRFAKHEIPFRFFRSVDEAKDWLLEK